MANARVIWYAGAVLAKVDDAMDVVVSEVTFGVEGRAKIGANVDTGFMRNSGYSITPTHGQRGGPQPSGSYPSSRTGKLVQRRAVPGQPPLPDHTGCVHFAAEYTTYQETRHHFIINGLRAAVKDVDGAVRKAGRLL